MTRDIRTFISFAVAAAALLLPVTAGAQAPAWATPAEQPPAPPPAAAPAAPIEAPPAVPPPPDAPVPPPPAAVPPPLMPPPAYMQDPQNPGQVPPGQAQPYPYPPPGQPGQPIPPPEQPGQPPAQAGQPGQPPLAGEAPKDAKGAEAGEKKTPVDKQKGTIYEGRDQFGGSSIIGQKSHVGVSAGYLRLPDVPYDAHYMHINPRVDLLWKKFSLGLNAPLNFELFSPKNAVEDNPTFSVRGRDWDQWTDYAKIIRFVQYGRKFDELYISATTMFASTLGHGFVMRRYIPNVEFDNRKLGLQFDYNHDFAGFESTISNVMGAPVIGAMPFLRPFAWFKSNDVLNSVSIGLTLVTDTAAPVRARRDFAEFSDFPKLRSGPNGVPSNYYLRFPRGKPIVDEYNNLSAETTGLYVYGIDAHIKVLKTRNVDIKPYVDISHMGDGGNGITAGVQWRFTFGEKLKSFFNIRTDFRAFDPDYEMSYFDSFYEVQKFQYLIPNRSDMNYARGYYPTKYEEVLSRRGDMRYGYYLEFNYELGKWLGVGFSINDASAGNLTTLALDGNQNPIKSGNGNFQAHISLPLPYFFSFHGTYHKVGFQDYADIFNFSGSNALFLATARFRPFNLIGVYAGLQEAWELDSWTGLYELVPAIQAGLDISYEF